MLRSATGRGGPGRRPGSDGGKAGAGHGNQHAQVCAAAYASARASAQACPGRLAPALCEPVPAGCASVPCSLVDDQHAWVEEPYNVATSSRTLLGNLMGAREGGLACA